MAKLLSGTRIYGNATIDGNLTVGNVSTTSGIFWSGNGAAYSSGSGASYTTGNVIITNATGVLPNVYVSTGGVGSPNSGYIKDYWQDINSPTREIGGIIPYINIKPTNNAYAYNSLTPIQIYDGGNTLWSQGFSVGASGSGLGDLFSTNTIGGSYYLNVANASVVTANTNGAIVLATSSKARFRIQYDGNTYIMGNTTITGNAASTSATTGALAVTGGAGVGGNLNVGGSLYLTSNATAGTVTRVESNIPHPFMLMGT